jgi:hypothetical protein
LDVGFTEEHIKAGTMTIQQFVQSGVKLLVINHTMSELRSMVGGSTRFIHGNIEDTIILHGMITNMANPSKEGFVHLHELQIAKDIPSHLAYLLDEAIHLSLGISLI